MLHGKKILLGVCGSIAAYKSALLVRLLIKEGAEVQVIQTDSAKTFITPLTLSTLSKKPVLSHFEKNETGEWNNHVELGLWADLFVVAPLSANTLAKMANGLCDNLLTAVYLSARCTVMVAPAMDLDMYQHPSTQQNLRSLASYGNIVLEAEKGELASGLDGQGRMMEPASILKNIDQYFTRQHSLKDKSVLITSGPTHEAIDPVRFIGNHSTGKMGMALAEEAARRGAKVTLVTGPTSLASHHPAISIWRVKSADEMLEATTTEFGNADIAIFAAAVSDYKPAQVASQKIKKENEALEIKLIKNKDIALEMGKRKANHQLTVGFALETENEEEHARLKLKSKNLDMIVLNSLGDKGAGFSHDTNKITIFDKNGGRHSFELKSKSAVAVDIIDQIETLIKA